MTSSVHFLPIDDPREGSGDLLAEQNAILELVVSGAALGQVLSRIAAAVERLARLRCSIIVTDRASNRILQHVAATDPGPIEPGTWTTPPVDDAAGTTSVIILHHREGQPPTPSEQRVTLDMSRLLGLALQREHGEQALRAAKEQTEAALALAARERASRLLFESNPVPLVLIDRASLGLLEVNESAIRHHGRTRAALQALSMLDLAAAEDRPRVRHFFDKLPPSGEARGEWREHREDGSLAHVEVVASHIDFNGTAAILAAAVDVTEQRTAAERLHLSEARFRDFALTSSDWFWEQDADLRFCRFSDVNDTPGLTHDKSIGRTRWEIVEAGVTEEQWRQHKTALAARLPFHDFRYERRGIDGRMHQITVSGVPVFDAVGEFRGYRGTGRDISEQVRAAEALYAAKEEAEAANRTKSKFLANMSHELRTPLNAVIGFSEIIRDRLLGPVDERYRSYADDIHKAGRHLLGIINDVLDLSKVEVGRLELQEERIDIRRVVDACLTLTNGAADAGHVRIVDTVAEDLPRIRVDRLRLTQVLLNILTNAVKFTPPGGEVRISTAPADEGALHLIVADTGIGMQPEEIPIALSPFGQVEGAYTRRFEGTGLGLPLAKTLIELHGGNLTIRSKAGIGTTVIIQLPANRVLPATAA